MRLHNRLAAAEDDKPGSQEQYGSLGSNENVKKGRRYRQSCLHRIKRKVSTKVILPLAALIGFVVHRLFLHEYAWVYQRCLVRFVIPTIAQKIVCQEAWSHMVANRDPALLWPESLVSSFSKQERVDIDAAIEEVRHTVAQGSAPQVANVHFTLTSALRVKEAQDLGSCSVESAARFCSSSPQCRINIWTVDRAADEFVHGSPPDGSYNDVKEYLTTLVDVIESTMDDSNESPLYCVRVINKPADYDDLEYDSTLVQKYTAGCPKPNDRSLHAGRRMREWLSSEAATMQIPEHSSDAWRLVALLEWGGLYLDLDVVPVSPLLLRLPKESVPIQHRVGAYRVNGGVLRLGDGLDEQRDWKRDYDDVLAHRAGGKIHAVLGRTFLKALEEDHLLWAPLLASQSLEEQKFGFLGPAALTRTFTSHNFVETVTVLAKEMVEPIIDKPMCSGWMEKKTLAMHFSSKKRKATWRSIVSKTECIYDIVKDACPSSITR